jgi:hypothetical protein
MLATWPAMALSTEISQAVFALTFYFDRGCFRERLHHLSPLIVHVTDEI